MAPEQAASRNPVRFGDNFELDPRAYELRRADRPLKLERIPMELLLLLVEQRGRLVTREEIIEKIWGKDVFLDADSSINSAVRKIRRALKDTPERPRFVQTVTGRGYRFIAPITDADPAPAQALAKTEAPTTGPEEKEEKTPAENSSAARVEPVEQRPAPNATTRLKKRWVGGLLATGFLLLLVLALWGWGRLFTMATSAPIRSIAILPLENLTGDPGQQYFVDGMTDALITTMAEIGSLQVISRTSAMRYRDSGKTIPEIAKELGVDVVVEGSVARSDNRVRIDVQLIQAPADRHLWARSYERDIQDVLELQGEVARTIASEIRIQLTPKEQARLGNSPPVNPEAYDVYLKARFFWNKRNKEAISKSIEYFNEAIRLDPRYAAAYSGLAEAYNVSVCGRPGGLAMAEAGPKAKAAALKAVELDDNSAEAHAALGFQIACFERNRAAAENEYRRAISLNQNYATAHHWYARLLLGWRDQVSLDQIRQALRLDPVSPNINGLYGDYLMVTGQFEKAVEQMRETVELDSQQYNSRIRLGFAYANLNRYAEAENEFKKAEEISPDSVTSLGALAYVYGLEGKRRETERMFPQVKAQALKTGHPSMISLVYVGLDQKDQATRWLEKAYEQKDYYLELLRSDAKFHALERSVKSAQ